jgi:hypothetical protein
VSNPANDRIFSSKVVTCGSSSTIKILAMIIFPDGFPEPNFTSQCAPAP